MIVENRLSSIDALKGLAILAVLLLHSLDPAILGVIYGKIHIGQAVPIFVMITFYLSFLSMERRGEDIMSYYSLSRIKKMVQRIILPFFVVLLVQCILLLVFSRLELRTILKSGGYGPGSYYPWIYLQVWLLVPVIYYLLKKCPVGGAVIVYVVCVALNVLCSYYCPDALWRLLVIRYLSLAVIAWIWMNFSEFHRVGKGVVFLLGALSLAYLLWFVRFDASPFIYNFSWKTQNYPVYFWSLLVVLFLIWLIPKMPGVVRNCLVWLGVHSWEVFLAQMFFVSCVSLKRFSQVFSFCMTQVFYVVFVCAVSIGSVWLFNVLKKRFKVHQLDEQIHEK